jgi:hypothetical protein
VRGQFNWRDFCFIGTQSIDMADHVAIPYNNVRSP